jgi:TRAP-type mannitol/chloroaromatic compound transport system permease small subunit
MFALCIGFSDNMQLVSVAKLLGQNLYGTVDILPNNYTITTGRYIYVRITYSNTKIKNWPSGVIVIVQFQFIFLAGLKLMVLSVIFCFYNALIEFRDSLRLKR